MTCLPVLATPAGALQPISGRVPALFVNAGSDAVRRFIEFFTANIRNLNSRAAYARAAAQFARWCDERGIPAEAPENTLASFQRAFDG